MTQQTAAASPSSSRILGGTAVFVAAVLWGTMGTASMFLPTAGPLAIGAASLGLGGIGQALVALPALKRDAALLRAHLPLVLIGAVSVAIHPLAFYTSVDLAGVAMGTVISIASAPLVAAIVERVVDGIPLTRQWLIAASLGVVGSILLVMARSGDAAGGGSAMDTILGILLGLVAGATYTLYSWAAMRLMREGASRGGAMAAVFGAGGLGLMPVLAVTGADLLATRQDFLVTAYVTAIPMFLGYIIFGYGLAHLTATMATTITLAEPAVAALLAVLVVHEHLGSLGWSGLALIALSLLLLVIPAETLARLRLART